MKKSETNRAFYYLGMLLLFLTPLLGNSQKQKRFTLLKSSATGLKFNNKIKSTKDKNILLYANFYSGAGVGVGDFNNDGLQDIFFAGNLVPDKLYLNKGNLTFKDVTKQSGIKKDEGWSAGVAIADVNNDGYLDIYICRELYDHDKEKRTNQLYINKGDGTFIESAKEFGLADQQRTRHATFFDYDKDGFLDVLLLTEPPNAGILSEYFGSFELKEESHLRLLRNTGKNSFVDVTDEAGVKYSGYPNSVSTSDLNNDGWTDLYITNDFSEPDFLFMNNKNGTFTNKVDTSFNHISHFSMGVDVADINNDGLLDIFVLDMVAEDNFRLKSNMSSMDIETFWRVVRRGGHYQYMFNTVQLNNGNNTFSDVAQLTGMTSTDWSWSNLIADFDNDGLKDTYITNGLLHDIRNTDADKAVVEFIDKSSYDWIKAHPDGGGITSVFDVLDLKKAVNIPPSQPLSNYAFKNMGDLRFKKVMDIWGLDKKSFSNGAAYADFDNDGDLDLVVNNINAEAFMYRNNSESINNSNFLRIQLKDKKHRTVLGSKVTLHSHGEIQFFETTNVRGIYSTSEQVAHFGLKDVDTVDEVVVEWPNGKETRLKNIKSNQVLELFMDEAVEKKFENSEVKSTFFTDITSENKIPFHHIENKFDDFKIQVLLPHKMSQFGPALAVADVNNDGLEDVFVGGAIGQPAYLYKQTSNGIFKIDTENDFGIDTAKEDLDAVFFDVDDDGDMDLYVVSGGYEYLEKDKNYLDRLYINNGKGNFIKSINLVEKSPVSGSVVIPADYDNDGDIDLFVGGRLTPHQYPLPTDSKLLENRNGKLVDVSNSKAPELKKLGMVTDAIWTDYDNDKDLDLVIVGEWMPVTVFENDKGKFSKVSISDFADTTGWWFSIEQGDFDKDGDMDFIVGNLGLNYKYKTSKDKPFDVHYKDFDGNGFKDIVLGYYNYGKHYPLRGFSCSSEQIPKLKKDIKKYDIFASMELNDVYGKDNLEKALHYETQTFASVFVENLGNSKFKAKELPVQAQISNINDFVVKDFNNDGNLDVLIVGNLFVSEIETTRNDAGTGLLLLGDGKNNFTPLTNLESGFFANKDAKNAKVLKGKDHDLILVGNNNDKLQVFRLNK